MVTIDDVVEEMIGLSFKLRIAQYTKSSALPEGTAVVIEEWKPKDPYTIVRYQQGAQTHRFFVLKQYLTPVTTKAQGVREYNVGLLGQRVLVEKLQTKLAEQESTLAKWKADEYKYKKSHDYWKEQLETINKELTRQRTALADNQYVLSQMPGLIQSPGGRF